MICKNFIYCTIEVVFLLKKGVPPNLMLSGPGFFFVLKSICVNGTRSKPCLSFQLSVLVLQSSVIEYSRLWRASIYYCSQQEFVLRVSTSLLAHLQY